MTSKDLENSYIVFALGTKEFIYPDIDIIYTKNSIEFYELYKISSLSKLQCFKSLSTLQEEYIRRVIGIIELCSKTNDNTQILNLIKKGYNFAYRYCASSDIFSLDKLFDFYKKRNPDPSLLEYQSLTSVMLYLYNIGYGINSKNNEDLNIIMYENYSNFVHLSLKKDIDRYINRHITLGQVNKIKNKYQLKGKKITLNRSLGKLRENEARKLGFVNNTNVSNSEDVHYKRRQLATQGVSKYYGAFERFLCSQDFNPFSLDTIEFTDNELNYLIENCVANQRYFKIDDSEMALYIISSLFLAMMTKEYRDTRALYLDKSKEDLFLSLKNQKEELNIYEQTLKRRDGKLTAENYTLNKTNEKLKSEIDNLNLQINKLTLTLNDKEDNKKELHSLRDMLFKLEYSDDPYSLTISIDKMLHALSQEKIVFVTGNISLLNKLKDLLPNIRCLDIDKLGADLTFIDNYSAVFVDVNHLSHSFYFKLTAQINKNKSSLCYITKKTNIEFIINEMYEFLFKE